MSGTVVNNAWTNVFYLNLTDDGTQTAADLKSIVDATVNAFHTRMTADLASTVVQTDAKATWITAIGTALEYDGTYTNTFTGGTVCNDVAACIVLNWSINQYYRGGHPRMYLAGPPNANVLSGVTLAAASQTTLASHATSWMGDVNALTGTHVTNTALGTVSYARGGAWRTPPVFYAYKSAGVRNIIGTQRRRLGGH